MTLTLNQGFWYPLGGGGGDDDDMIFISKSTASSASSLEITSGIDSTYPIYKIYGNDIITSASAGPKLGYQVSVDGGSSYGQTATTVNYDLVAYASAASGEHATQQTGEVYHGSTGLQTIGIGTGSTGHAGFEMTFYSPSLTSANYKMFDCICTVSNDAAAYVRRFVTATMFNVGTNDIDAIEFKTSSGTFDGVFTLYGIKDS